MTSPGLFDEGLAYTRGRAMSSTSSTCSPTVPASSSTRDVGRTQSNRPNSSSAAAGSRRSPRTIALTVLARIRARRGDPNVLSLIAEARSLAEPTGELQRIAPVAIAAAEAAWLIGDAAGAREATEQALDLAVKVEARARYREPAGVAQTRRHHRGSSRAGGRGPNRLELVGEFEAAAAAWQELGRPYEAALALADAGSEAALRRSLGLLTGLNARATAALVTRRLRSLGAREIPRGPRPSTRRNPAELTGPRTRNSAASR